MGSPFDFPKARGSILWRRFSSGLELVVDPVPGCGVVGIAFGYRAGARDEPPGQEGLAHLLEHLMFRGSLPLGAGAIDRTAAELGGSVNAYTGHDQMVFHWVLPAGPWERAVELEVERMESLELSREVLRLEQEIVKAEIDAASEDGWDRLERAVFRPAVGGASLRESGPRQEDHCLQAQQAPDSGIPLARTRSRSGSMRRGWRG